MNMNDLNLHACACMYRCAQSPKQDGETVRVIPGDGLLPAHHCLRRSTQLAGSASVAWIFLSVIGLEETLERVPISIVSMLQWLLRGQVKANCF